MQGIATRPVFVVGSFVMACCWFTRRLPGAGEHVHAERFLMEPGGKGLNVAVGLARLGTPVSLLLGVGDDAAAAQALTLLDQEGIDRAHVHAFEGPSGHGVGLIDDAGENAIAIHPGANHRLGAEHAQAAAAEIGAAALVCGQFEVSDAVLIEAFRLARSGGVPTALNPSPWRPIEPELLALTDTLVVNEHEAGAWLGLGGALDLERADHLHTLNNWRRAHPGTRVMVTLGGAGCLHGAPGDGDVVLRAAFAVSAQDSTGCGDAFTAAWCDAQARGWGSDAAMDWAQAAGAWLAQRAGVLTALPHRAELSRWLDQGLRPRRAATRGGRGP